MVNLKSVRESNLALRSAAADQVSLWVGATSGIALHTLTEYARNCNRPNVYIVGRSDAKLSNIKGDLEKINPQGSYVSIKSEISLLKNVDAACEEFRKKEKSLDLLLMCPGYIKLSRIENADGLEDTISLRYYVRMRFVQNLLPLLSSSSSSRIVSIFGAGREGRLNEDDLELKHTFSHATAACHTATMNTLALEEVASSHPTISCIHVFPGLVLTGVFTTFAQDWYFPLRFLFMWGVLPIANIFSVSLQETGERHLFYATSARYPPAGVVDPLGRGVPLPKGVEVAKGADWNEGSGCYLLDRTGETVGDKKLLDEYRKRDMGKMIWDHTQEVFDRVLSKT